MSKEYYNKADTSDFLAFSDSPQASPQPQKFNPAHYSSPQNRFQRGRHPSPRNYYQYNRRHQNRRWSGGSRSYNSSNNSSFSQYSWTKDDADQSSGISMFIHPSFLEDPWAELEAKLNEMKEGSRLEKSESEEGM